MTSITIAIPEQAAKWLAELARRQFRALRQLAAVMLLEAIERNAKITKERPANEQRGAVSQ
jgi:hypothetical protein